MEFHATKLTHRWSFFFFSFSCRTSNWRHFPINFRWNWFIIYFFPRVILSHSFPFAFFLLFCNGGQNDVAFFSWCINSNLTYYIFFSLHTLFHLKALLSFFPALVLSISFFHLHSCVRWTLGDVKAIVTICDWPLQVVVAWIGGETWIGKRGKRVILSCGFSKTLNTKLPLVILY